MSALVELKSGQRKIDASYRRWFYSPDMDLVLWYEAGGSISGFELYYDKNFNEHVFIWRNDGGFAHLAVDDGEQGPVLEYKEAPILIPDGDIDVSRIKRLFDESSDGLPDDLVLLVRRKLEQFSG